jgi:hypothetical protein
MVFGSAVGELMPNVATPSPPVVPGFPVIVLSLPVAATVTLRPTSGVPVASLTVTVIVLVALAGIVAGSSVTEDWAPLGGAGGAAWTSMPVEVTLP